MLLAVMLSMSLILPAAGMDAYAVTGSATDTSGKTEQSEPYISDADQIDADSLDSLPSESNSSEAPQPATSISGYKTYYNKCRDEALEIEVDITPAVRRDVQLQRYNSSGKTWDTILTVTLDATEHYAYDAAGMTDEDQNMSSPAEAAETEAEQDADTAAQSADNNTAHMTISVPGEERMKTSSLWRIYVPATDTETEAVSENITILTRNLDDINLSARAACVYRINPDGSGNMLFSKNSYTRVAQASTTKLMTAVILLESGLIGSSTKISPHAASTPWGSGRLAAGDVYSNKDLLYAMLLPSSNDAATAIAERVGGSEAAFVKMMNAKAKEMGLTRTQFRNPHGLDADGHYTTALELAKLTAYAYRFSDIRDCWATQCKTITSLERKRSWTLWSTNAIFNYVKNFLGGKTGTESNAGCCFTGVYTCGDCTYVTVVLGSGYGFSRWSDTKKLHKYIQDYAATSY